MSVGRVLELVRKIDHAFTQLGVGLVQAVDVLSQTGDNRRLLTVKREVLADPLFELAEELTAWLSRG